MIDLKDINFSYEKNIKTLNNINLRKKKYHYWDCGKLEVENFTC